MHIKYKYINVSTQYVCLGHHFGSMTQYDSVTDYIAVGNADDGIDEAGENSGVVLAYDNMEAVVSNSSNANSHRQDVDNHG